MWEVSQGKSVWAAAVRDQQGDDPDENHYNVNNFIGALRRIGQLHTEHPEAARPPVLFLLISKWIPFLRPPQILTGEGRNDLINPARSRCCIKISRR